MVASPPITKVNEPLPPERTPAIEAVKFSPRPTVVYLAGPMTGLPENNFPAFNMAAQRWRNSGFEVINPAETDNGDASKPRPYYMRIDFHHVIDDADWVVVLDGWEDSDGAKTEVAIAIGLEKPVYSEWHLPGNDPYTVDELNSKVFGDDREPDSSAILPLADELVSSTRQANYGHPLDDFSKAAAMWSAILDHEVAPEQVPLCMIAVKLSRECHIHKVDNLVDICGYAKTNAMVHEERKRRAVEAEDFLELRGRAYEG